MSDADSRIRFVDAAQVRPLRQEVLRVGMPDATVEFDGDDDPDTYHLAVVDDTETIVAVSTWMSRPFGDLDLPAMQLRGMATKRLRQKTGLGTALLDAGFRQARSRGVEVVWANARDEALPFYLRHGFEIIGDGFIESVTQLPHHRVLRTL